MAQRILTPRNLEAARRLTNILQDKKVSENLTQVKLAERMGFARQATVSQFSRGMMPMSLETIAAFADALNVSPTEIEPDFFELLRIKDYVRPEYKIEVRYTLSGKRPIPSVKMTHIKEPAAMDHYAVAIDTDDYKKARIRKGSELIVGVGLELTRDEDLYIRLSTGETVIGQFIGRDEHDKAVVIRDLLTMEPRNVKDELIEVCDVIVGVQNPSSKRRGA